MGAISGVVGSYASVDPRVEELVCARLGLRPAEASTQVIQRDRHAEYVTTLAVVASTLDTMATEIRHLARTEVREVQEPFAQGQKGSSAMPHKRNPVVCERVSGLARVMRGYAQTALENVALWHERDISHSSAERIVFPDATGLLDFMLNDMTWVIDGLVVFPERMAEHVKSLGGDRVQPVGRCWRWWTLGWGATMRTGSCSAPPPPPGTRARPSATPSRPIPRCRRTSIDAQLDALFDPGRFLRNLGGVFDRLEKLPVEAVVSTAAGGLHAQGKVRDVFEAGADALLLVASDRISAFDVVLPDPVPDKGRVLTGLLALLVRAHARPRGQPRRERRSSIVPRAVRRGLGARRTRDAGATRRRDPRGVRRPRLPQRLRLEGVRTQSARSAAWRCPPASSSPTGCPSRSSRPRRRRPRVTTSRSRSRRRPTWWAAGSPSG